MEKVKLEFIKEVVDVIKNEDPDFIKEIIDLRKISDENPKFLREMMI